MQFLPILIWFWIMVPAPINVSFPTIDFPQTIVPGEIFTLSFILTSCSIIDPVFIIVFLPIFAFILIITPGKIKDPSPILTFLCIIAFSDFKINKLNFFFLKI